MFERLDKDGNGSVSAEEFEAAKKNAWQTAPQG
nr:EF-hand domain-containing protein [Sulfitobacter sp. 15WGC]